jgi:hypothetical protein
MALQTLNTIKEWFKTGLKPTQTQFWDTWDSFRHKYEKVPVKDVEGIDELLLSKADKIILDNHLADKNAHAPQVNTDWNSESGFSQLINKPEFKTINGQEIVGNGDIIINNPVQTLDETLASGNNTNKEIILESNGGDITTVNNMGVLLRGNNGTNSSLGSLGFFTLGTNGLASVENKGQITVSHFGGSTIQVRNNEIAHTNIEGNSSFLQFDNSVKGHFIQTIPPKTGTIALLSDIPDGSTQDWQTVLDAGSTKVQVNEMQIKVEDSVNNPSRFEMFSPEENSNAFVMSTSRGISFSTRGKGEITIGSDKGVIVDGGNDGVEITTGGSGGINLTASAWGSIHINQNEGLEIDARSNTKGVKIWGRNTGIHLYGGTGTIIEGGYLKIESPTSLNSPFYINRSSGFVFNNPFSENPYGNLRMNYRNFTESDEEKEAIQIIGNSYTTDTAYFEKDIKFVNKEFFTRFDATNVAASTTILLPTGTKGNVTLPISVNGITADENGNVILDSTSNYWDVSNNNIYLNYPNANLGIARFPGNVNVLGYLYSNTIEMQNGSKIQADGNGTSYLQVFRANKWLTDLKMESTGFVKTGGLSNEFLKADGSIDSNTYVQKNTLIGEFRFYGVDSAGTEKMFKMPSSSFDTILCVDAFGTDMVSRTIDKDIISNLDTSIPTSKAVKAAVETKQIKDKQIIINGDIDVQENWNGQTIIFKSSGIVRMPIINTEEFSFNAITLEGVNLTWQWANQIEWVFGEPEITPEKKYLNLTKLGNTNQIILSV